MMQLNDLNYRELTCSATENTYTYLRSIMCVGRVMCVCVCVCVCVCMCVCVLSLRFYHIARLRLHDRPQSQS
jgi:hypothetical protein